MKGLAPVIAAVLYIGIALGGITIVVTTGLPALQEMKDVSSIEQAQDAFSKLNSYVKEVASEGEGSTRVISPFKIQGGDLKLEKSSITWNIETNKGILDPRTRIKDGNVILSSEADTSVSKTRINGQDYYIMENSILKVWLKNIGSKDNQKSINTTNLIYKIKNKKEDVEQNVTLLLDEDISKSTGTGYTTVKNTGDNLARGKYTAYIYNSYKGIDFKIELVLETGADFLTINSETI